MKATDKNLRAYLYENRVSPTPAFTVRLDGVCAQLRRSEEGAQRARDAAYRMAPRRRALLIAIAAVILLAACGTAYAIYWSSTQRAKDYVQSEQATDDRLSLARRQADAVIAGMDFYCPIDAAAEVDGLTITLRSMTSWALGDTPEVHVYFDASDAKTGDASRLTDIDYTLTIGGRDYPVYAKAEGTPRALPIVNQSPEAAANAACEIWFRTEADTVADGTPMTLSGTLYAYDEAGARGEALGSFALDFIYEVQTEQMEAARARVLADILANMEQKVEAQQEAVAALPDEMTPLNITQDEWTFVDACVTSGGVLLGDRVVTRGADFPKVYLDGYEIYGEGVSSIFTPDESRQRLDIPWEVEYYGTSEMVTRYPWYAPLSDLPETVLFAVLRDAGSTQRRKGGIEEEMLSYEWDAVELLLRVNPRTGEIAFPKDDAERAAWREETLRLAADGRNESYEVQLFGQQSIGDVTVQLYDMIVRSVYGHSAMVECLVNGLYYPQEMNCTAPQVYIDGVLQSETAENAARRAEYAFSPEEAQAWVERNGGWQRYHDCFGDFDIDLGPRPNRLPDTFTLRFVWDVYDRNEDWERVFIGTFDITTTVRKTDIPPWNLLE